MIQYLTAHWTDIAASLTSIAIGARVIVKLLPNPKADTYFEEVIDLLKHVGLVCAPASNTVVATTPDATPAK